MSPAQDERRPTIEEGARPSRVRSGVDVLRLLVALLTLAALVGTALLATETAEGVAEDVGEAWERVPTLVSVLLDATAVLAVFALVVAVVAEHLLRRKLYRLVSGFGAAVAAGLVAAALGRWITASGSARLLEVVDVRPGSVAVTVVVLVAFLTAVDLASVRWRVVATVVVVAVSTPAVAVGAITPVTALAAVLVGRVVGLATRLVAGVPTGRPVGDVVVDALDALGLPVAALAPRPSRVGVRGFRADLLAGGALDIVLVDRDSQTTGLLVRSWRLLRFRSALAGRAAWSPRGVVEREALATYAAAAAGVRAPRVRVLEAVGPEAVLLARDAAAGRPLADLDPHEVSDALLADLWEQVRLLHRSRIGHRSLDDETVRVLADGRTALAGFEEATVAGSDVLLRLDVAQLLVVLALVVGPERAVASARRAYGGSAATAAAGLLQPVALPRHLRRRLGEHEGLLADLQQRLLADGADREVDVAPARLERLRPRTVVTVVAATGAAYVLATQIGSVDLIGAIRDADPMWALVAVVGSAVTYVGAAGALVAFTPGRLSLWRTTAVQLAASFVTLVTPPAVGQVTLNLRYLRRTGVPPLAAATVVAITQLASLLITVVLLVALGLATGTSRGPSLVPSGVALAAVGIVLGAGLLVAAIPRARRLVTDRLRGRFREALPRLLELLRQPWRLVGGLAGNLAMTAGYVVALDASLRAFGTDLGLAETAIAYLAGSAVGSAAPTPGGLGAVEAAMVAALAAAGVPGSIALPAVLLFRTATFWLPVPPGWLAFSALQRREAV